MKVLSFGEIIWDVFPTGRTIGGAPLNFSGHSARAGAESYMLSAVGEDALGDEALECMKKMCVDSSFVSKNKYPTGQCLVTLDRSGVPSYQVLREAAYDFIDCPNTQKINSTGFDAFCFGTLAQRSECSRRTLNKILSECTFGEVFCDINLRDGCYDEESINTCFSNATVLKLSDEEAPRLAAFTCWKCADGNNDGEAMQKLFEKYPRLKYILYTRGAKGSTVYGRDGQCENIPSVETKVVSTVGAGDSFGAVWLSMYLSGRDAVSSAQIASRVSSYVVSVSGALPMYNIREFLN